MPSVFKNQEPIRLVLKGDIKEMPQPAFFVRPLTFGQMKAFTSLMGKFSTAKNVGEVFDDLQDTLDDALVGWEHMGSYQHGTDSAGDFLNASEVMELVMLILRSAQVGSSEGN